MLLALEAEHGPTEPSAATDVFVVDATDGAVARDVTHELRSAGLRADRAFDGRSMKAQMKAAGRSGARVAIIVGADEAADGTATLRDLVTREQTMVKRDEVVAHVRTMLEEQRNDV